MPLTKPAEKAKPSKIKPKTTAKQTAVIPTKKTTKPKAKPAVKAKSPVAKPVTVAEVMQVKESAPPPWLEDKAPIPQAPKVMSVGEILKAAGIRV